MASQNQAELREFIRRLNLNDNRLGDLTQRTSAVRQRMQEYVTDGRAGGGVSLTTVNITVTGGLAPGGPSGTTYVPMPNTDLKIIGAVTGTDYGTFSSATGNFSLGLILDPSDNSLDFYPRGPVSPRFLATFPLAFNRGISHGVTNNVLAVRPPATTGYGYLVYSFSGSFACQYPVGPLNWEDSEPNIGSGTATTNVLYGMSAAIEWNSACFLVNTYPGVQGFSVCAPVSTPVYMGMGWSGVVNFRYTPINSTSNFCPAPIACPGTPSRNAGMNQSAITSKTDPGFDLSTKFDCTWFTSFGDDIFHNSAPRTVRFWEQ